MEDKRRQAKFCSDECRSNKGHAKRDARVAENRKKLVAAGFRRPVKGRGDDGHIAAGGWYKGFYHIAIDKGNVDLCEGASQTGGTAVVWLAAEDAAETVPTGYYSGTRSSAQDRLLKDDAPPRRARKRGEVEEMSTDDPAPSLDLGHLAGYGQDGGAQNDLATCMACSDFEGDRALAFRAMLGLKGFAWIKDAQDVNRLGAAVLERYRGLRAKGMAAEALEPSGYHYLVDTMVDATAALRDKRGIAPPYDFPDRVVDLDEARAERRAAKAA
jgi:hypothetical protein